MTERDETPGDSFAPSQCNAAKDVLKILILTEVKISDEVLGHGNFGTVYKADYNGVPCAAKTIKSSIRPYLCNPNHFIHECLRHSKLDHKNIVKMFGVSFEDINTVSKPVLVMELMEYTLAELFLNDESQGLFIPMYVKLSILQDISAGILYLHSCNPPIAHCTLVPSNILLSGDLVAKLADFENAKEVTDGLQDINSALTRRCFKNHYHDGFGLPFINLLSQDVSMFGHLAYNVIAQTKVRHPYPYYLVMSLRQHHRGYYQCRFGSDNIDDINEGSLKTFVMSCLNGDLRISVAHERISGIKTRYYSTDATVKNAYSLALRKGQAQLKELQIQLVGAENTGKTCLISSFLDEGFVEQQKATEGADMNVCKVSSKNWTRCSDHHKSGYLNNVFFQSSRGSAFKYMIMQTLVKPELKSSNCSKSPLSSHSSVTMHNTLSVSDSKVDDGDREEESVEGTEIPMQYDFLAIFWDFAGQVIFHNTHSVFISNKGAIIITFDASMKLTDKILPRQHCCQPPEYDTMISSIHYWLQVVHTLYPMHENVLLVGTHIDKLDKDIDKARQIAKDTILPKLHEELKFKPYICHLSGYSSYKRLNQRHRYGYFHHSADLSNLDDILQKCCFFVSNKCPDEEIRRLKVVAINVGISLQKKQPIYFLKIEQALMQQKEPVISISQMLDLVTNSSFALAESSSEFQGTLKYFHDKRIILHFSQIESLKNIVILSPQWLAKLVSYVIAADSFKIGDDADVNKASERLHKYGVLHDCLLQHMLKKFHSEYPTAIQVTKQQVVDILLCFHLLVRISKDAWFREEGFPTLPKHSDTFIVPCLIPKKINKTIKNIPNTDRERIIYFQFSSGFIPVNLLNQLIAACICRNVKRRSPLLWMRYGKIGLQLGAHQKYYISQCEEHKSIQLTITVDKSDSISMQERKELIDDIFQQIGDIMKLFMPAVLERPDILFHCPLCTTLHITLEEVCSGNTIYCASSSDDAVVSPQCYNNLLPAPQQFHPGKSIPDATILEQRPKMYHLNKIVVPKVKSEWIELAYAMGYSPGDVDAIQKDNSSVKLCCQNLFSNWLKTNPDATWRKLLICIEDVFKLSAAAEEIRKSLRFINVQIQQQPEEPQTPHKVVVQLSQEAPASILVDNKDSTVAAEDAKLKEKPTHKQLSRITVFLASNWRKVGYELMEPEYVQNIESTTKSNDDKCLDMLVKWLETDTTASYFKLINALKECDLHNAAEKTKNKVLT